MLKVPRHKNHQTFVLHLVEEDEVNTVSPHLKNNVTDFILDPTNKC